MARFYLAETTPAKAAAPEGGKVPGAGIDPFAGDDPLRAQAVVAKSSPVLARADEAKPLREVPLTVDYVAPHRVLTRLKEKMAEVSGHWGIAEPIEHQDSSKRSNNNGQ